MSRNRIVLFDGECRMCSGWARFVSRRDERGEMALVPMQSPEGRAILDRHGFPPDAIDTIVFVNDQRALTRSDAVFAILERLPAPWPAARLLRVVPRVLRDAVYDLIARNRRRLFGAQKCAWAPPAAKR